MIKILKIIFILLMTILPAEAHWSDMAAMQLDINNSVAKAELTFPTPFLSEVDLNKDGFLSKNEFDKSNSLIHFILNKNIVLLNNGIKGDLSIEFTNSLKKITDSNESQTTLNLSWEWDKTYEGYTLKYNFFTDESKKAHCLVSASINGEVKSFVFDHNNRKYSLTKSSFFGVFQQFLILGVEHIATGYDHILFLFALLLAGGRFSYLIKIVTSFTLAHSITLSLAVLGIVSAPSKIIESIIAASIVYVAIENFWRKKDEVHWSVVFLFGLIHGMGFANILRELEIAKEQLFYTLFSFNLGIEFGQLVIVLIFWLVVNKFLKNIISLDKIKYIGSFFIALISLYWFFERVFLT